MIYYYGTVGTLELFYLSKYIYRENMRMISTTTELPIIIVYNDCL